MAQLPIHQSKKEVSNEIKEAAINLHCAKIRYRSKDNEVSERTIEPYEVKNGKLFGYCQNKGGIRSFNLSGVLAAIETKKTFKPRYPIRINQSTHIK